MAYFTYEQEQELISLIQEKLEEATKWGKDREIKKYRQLLEACNKSHYDETLKEDIDMVAQNFEDEDGNPIKLTPEQEQNIMHRLYKYDYSDYNDYIDQLITEELGL